jgi:5-formyltetrahydrofolate cyclo-ligase
MREHRDPTCHAQGTTKAAHTAKAGFFLEPATSWPAPGFSPMPLLDDQKRALRAEVRARIPGPGSPEFISASLRAQKRLLDAALLQGAGAVALYRALPTECGTASIAAGLQAQGREVCYPVVVPGDRALQFRRAAGAFVAGALGIEEPTGAPVPLREIALLVVPALAVDAAGRRLGRGKGHYDATLAAWSGQSVALVFDSQLVPEVPVGEHDRRVGAVCTDLRWLSIP